MERSFAMSASVAEKLRYYLGNHRAASAPSESLVEPDVEQVSSAGQGLHWKATGHPSERPLDGVLQLMRDQAWSQGVNGLLSRHNDVPDGQGRAGANSLHSGADPN